MLCLRAVELTFNSWRCSVRATGFAHIGTECIDLKQSLGRVVVSHAGYQANDPFQDLHAQEVRHTHHCRPRPPHFMFHRVSSNSNFKRERSSHWVGKFLSVEDCSGEERPCNEQPEGRRLLLRKLCETTEAVEYLGFYVQICRWMILMFS